MSQRTSIGSILFGVTLLLALPGRVFGQSAISGLVTDTTGAVLPGVTVEAASPVLIEKVRSVVTDTQGRYTVVNLRPGTYSLTFTLIGFGTVKHDGIELPSNTTLPVNAELKVGALEETVTVSGQSPVVDLQNVQRTQVISRDTIDALPVSRNYKSVGALMIGVRSASQQMGDLGAGTQSTPSVHGAPADTTIQFDGMLALTYMDCGGAGACNQYHNDGIAQEVVYQTSGVKAEVSQGGLLVNIIPKEGGNTMHGGGFFSYQNGRACKASTFVACEAGNVTPELKAKGLVSATRLDFARDLNPYIGGPIKNDRMWFVFSGRSVPVHSVVANSFYPDGSPGIVDNNTDTITGRITAQATQKNKIVVFYDRIFKHIDHQLSPGEDPATGTHTRKPTNYSVEEVKWNVVASNKLLFESGFIGVVQDYLATLEPGLEQPRGTPLWYSTAPHFDLITNRRWNSGTCNLSASSIGTTLGRCHDIPVRYTAATSVSYVTGSHNLKTGLQWGFGSYRKDNNGANADLLQVYSNGVPQFVDVGAPANSKEKINADLGIFGQDQWTIKHFTVNAGIRFEHVNGSIEQTYAPAGRFLPARIFGPINNLPNWNNWSPRVGIAYDVLGDGKTAIKASVGRYMGFVGPTFAGQYNPMQHPVDRRNWLDCALIPGTSTCDPAQIGAPGYHDDIAQDNEIGPSGNQNFGVAISRMEDPSLKRPYNVEYAASIQHELRTGFSVFFGWYRRTYYNIPKTVNQLVGLSDYTPFQTPSPLNNGEQITVYNLNLNKQGQTFLVDTASPTNRRRYNAFEMSANWLLPNGGTVFAGGGPERLVSTVCDVPNPNQLRFCDQTGNLYQELGRVPTVPWVWDLKLIGTTPLPQKLVLGVSLQSLYGNAGNNNNFEAWLSMNWVVPAAVFPNGQRTVSTTVPLIAPGTQYLPRRNQLDISLKRIFTVNNIKLEPRIDVYNLLNSSVIISQNQTFGNSLGTPMEILQGRLPRVSLQIDF